MKTTRRTGTVLGKPSGRTAGPSFTRRPADSSSATAVTSSGVFAPTSTADTSHAANAYRPGGTAAGVIAATPAGQPPIENGEDSPPETPTNTKRHSTVTRRIVICGQCGAEFVALRPTARYCSAYCRRRAWLERNPARSAEILAADRARLRAHIEANGGVWEDRTGGAS